MPHRLELGPPARLVLEDGSVWHGYGFGAEGTRLGPQLCRANCCHDPTTDW